MGSVALASNVGHKLVVTVHNPQPYRPSSAAKRIIVTSIDLTASTARPSQRRFWPQLWPSRRTRNLKYHGTSYFDYWRPSGPVGSGFETVWIFDFDRGRQC